MSIQSSMVQQRHTKLVGWLLMSSCIWVLPATAFAQLNEKPIVVPATVHGYQSADLYAKIGGYIKEIFVDIGDVVKAGQPLVVLDIPEMGKQLIQKQSLILQAEAESSQAKARVTEAAARLDSYVAAVTEARTNKDQKEALVRFQKIEFDRKVQLASRGAIQPSIVDSARYQLEAAQAELAAVDAKVASAEASLTGAEATVVRAEADTVAAESNIKVAQSNLEYVKQLIEYATIRAPFDGKVTERMLDAGAFVQSAEGNSAAKPILRLVRDDKVRIVFSLSSSNIANLDIGDRVILSRIDALPGKTFEGKVTRFSAAMDAKTRMMRVEVDLDNSDNILRPGFFGYASVYPD